MMPITRFLDEQIPLDAASFDDVCRLGVDLPTRYAECFAELDDGRHVRLRRPQQLLGRTDAGDRQSFYFTCERGQVIRLRTDRAFKREIRGMHCWSNVTFCRAFSSSDPRVRRLGSDVHRIIAVDGSLLFMAPEPAAVRSGERTPGSLGALLRLTSPSAATPA